MFFKFKEQVEDFIVTERLQKEISGHGDRFWLQIEKKSLNTMDIIEALCQHFPLKREQLGISGLKDKQGITRQRLSIAKNKLKTYGGQSAFLDFLHQKFGDQLKILATTRNQEPLHIGKNQGNHFTIRLRKKEELPSSLKTTLENKLEKSKETGFPNAFGIQRFGKGNKNFKKASKLFEEGINPNNSYEVRFKLQSFGNMRFNELVMHRREQQDFLLDGDILVDSRNAFGSKVASYSNDKLLHFDYRKEKESHIGSSHRELQYPLWTSDFNPELWMPTGMVLGTEQLLCQQESLARHYDDLIWQASNFAAHGAKISKKWQIYGFRRPLRCKVQDLSWHREKEGNLILEFSLPTGAYASVFLAQLLEEIDPKGCISNGLIIPRIRHN